MSPKEIERLVVRCLDGSMSAAEEEEFFVRVALDEELRKSYQAQRIVESALGKARRAAPRQSHAARERIIALAEGASSVAARTATTEVSSSGAARVAAATRGGVASRWGRDLLVAMSTIAVGGALWLGVENGVVGGIESARSSARDDSAQVRSDAPASIAPATVDTTLTNAPSSAAAVTGVAASNTTAEPDRARPADEAPVSSLQSKTAPLESSAETRSHGMKLERVPDATRIEAVTPENGALETRLLKHRIPPATETSHWADTAALRATPRETEPLPVDTLRLDVRVRRP
jgi:hypothetical protein